ncbi:hypothetical protein [Accumulibacter sp.]|uniref:hypothetical protein n=1 Tax=Accumulibacter sp. TaxID=2053492 RepID=UPI00261F937E|nr:hypothetical protein [Accumulibacter sp.]
MNNVYRLERSSPVEQLPPEGTRRVTDDGERVLYNDYWIKTYPVPADSLQGKKSLIEALARRLFNHTEHGLNIPGCRLGEARQCYESESDPARRRVKAGMLAGALFNRAVDIFRRLVELQADGIEIRSDNALMRECGQCLLEAMELGRFVLHRSGEEGIDELWGEPFRAFSIAIEDFYESRYIKIGQCMRDIDLIAEAMISNFGCIPTFEAVAAPIQDFANAAKVKTETLRTDPGIFDVWSHLVTAGERLANFTPQAAAEAGERRPGSPLHSISDGLQLLRNGRDLVFYIARARTPMAKSTREYIERCEAYLTTGRAPFIPAPLPA